jgi:hypothetical protein
VGELLPIRQLAAKRRTVWFSFLSLWKKEKGMRKRIAGMSEDIPAVTGF